MDKFIITHGNGEQLSQMLHELRGDRHLDVEEEYYCRAKDTGKIVEEQLPSFEDSIGYYSPGGAELRDLKNFAARSNLVSTGVSDKDRACREIQAVGCRTTVVDDHTYAVLKNYISDEIHGAKCVHTIGNEFGEIASAVIVQSEEQKHYSHQAEQFARRHNVSPKVHVSDICPQGTALWQTLFKNVVCVLGWFHFLNRITKTLRMPSMGVFCRGKNFLPVASSSLPGMGIECHSTT